VNITQLLEEAIAQSVRKEIAAGGTTPLDEVFPPQSP